MSPTSLALAAGRSSPVQVEALYPNWRVHHIRDIALRPSPLLAIAAALVGFSLIVTTDAVAKYLGNMGISVFRSSGRVRVPARFHRRGTFPSGR